MGGNSGPPPIDFQAQAQAQGAANRQAGIDTARLSNPNINTPFGSQRVTFKDGVPTVDQTLSPESQKLFDLQNRLSGQLGGIAEGAIGRVGETFGKGFDTGGFQQFSVTPDVAGREAVTQALIEREQPRFDRNRQQTQNQLLTRGFNPGTEGFNEQIDQLNRRENDFNLAAILAGGQEQSRLAGLESGRRGQQFQEEAFLRNLPLAELNALRSGAQPNLPQFQGFQGAQVGAAPVFDAALAQQQAGQARAQQGNAFQGGLFDLVGAGLGAAGAAGGFGNLFSFGGSGPEARVSLPRIPQF